MARSVALRLYLAARARADRAARKDRDRPAPGPGAPPGREAERLGEATQKRPDGPLVWVHSGTDPAAAAARELARRIRQERDDLSFLFTTCADTRRDPAPEFPSQFVPDESMPAIRAFFDHWRPDLSIWTEPDMRPALTHEASQRGIPMLFLDTGANLPDAQAWRLWPNVAGELLEPFEHLIVSEAARVPAFRRLGAMPGRIEALGLLSEGPPALPCNHGERDALAKLLSGRPTWLATRLVAAETGEVIEAHRQAMRRTHRLLLLIVPDRSETGPALRDRLQNEGFVAALRSDGNEPEHDVQVYVADTEDEFGLWYRLAAVSFLGGTLSADAPATNPYEAAALGSAILHGPETDPFAQAYQRFARAAATRRVTDADSLAEALDALLSPDVAATMARAAWNVSTSGAEVTDRALDLILTLLDERGV